MPPRSKAPKLTDEEKRARNRRYVAEHRARKKAAAAEAEARGEAPPKPKRKKAATKRRAPARRRRGSGPYAHLSGPELVDEQRREDLVAKALDNRQREGELAELTAVEARATETVQQTLAAFDTLGVELAEVVPADVAGEVARRLEARKGALADVLGQVWQ